MKICFLVHYHTPLSQAANARALINAALGLRHEVSLAFAGSLAYRGEVRANVVNLKAPLAEDTPFDEIPFHDASLSGFDVLWILSFGQRDTFQDRMQMLKLLPTRLRIVNGLDALFNLHSKISQLSGPMPCPETHISSDADALWDIVRNSGAEWVVKPVAESMGRNVFRLAPGDSNTRPLLQNMTGHDGSRYCLLQRYVPEVKLGEKRVLAAGGEIIGQYLRKPTDDDHRGNLHQGAGAELCDLTPEEQASCQRVATYLLERGVYFAGLDIAWPWLLEWNIVNPGGIVTIHKLSGGNLAETVVAKVLNLH